MLANFSRSRDNKFLHKRNPSKNNNTHNTMTSDEEYMETDRK